MKKIIFIRQSKKKSLFLDEQGTGENMSEVLRTRFAEDHLGVELSATEQTEEKETIHKKLGENKIKLLALISICLSLLLFGKAAYLQVSQGSHYRVLAEGNRIRIQPIKAQRGIFFDRLGRQLVKNIPVFSLRIIPADLPRNKDERMAILTELAKIIEFDKNEVIKRLENTPSFSYQPIVINDNIGHETALPMIIKTDEMPGVVLATDYRRQYIIEDDNFLASFSHVLGYTGKIAEEELGLLHEKGYLITDFLGKYGLELNYESMLRGQYGKKQVEVNALGKESKVISEIKPEPGHNLLLTIDIDLQKRAEEILLEELVKNGRERGSLVILNPQNGEILALVTLPSFNNNDFAHGISSEKYQTLLNDSNKPLFNRTISGEYPSGSTVKPVVASAALEEGIITQNTTINSYGGIHIKSWFFPDWKAGGHGLTDVRKAIAESVNTFFYFVGGGFEDFVGLGVARIKTYAEMFGLNNKTGIDLPSEASGFLPTKDWKEEVKNERWYVGDTYHLAIGQGDILVTPLQIANMISVFANGGTLYKPHLVKKVLDLNGEIIEEIEPEIMGSDFISQNNIQVIREGLRQAVTYGSARRLFNAPVAVAGKTGTAQWSSTKDPHAWFTCFAPYDKPQIAIAVLVEESGEGSDVALPVAQKVIEWWFGPK